MAIEYLNKTKKPNITGLLLCNNKKDLLEFPLKNHFLYLDTAGRYANYESGIFGPVLLHIENKQVNFVEELTHDNFHPVLRKYGLETN